MSPSGLSQGLKVSCSCSSLEERSVILPWMEGQRDRHNMPSNAGVAGQKLKEPPWPQTSLFFPEGKGQSHSKKSCRRHLSFDSNSTACGQLLAWLDPAWPCCCVLRSPSPSPQRPWLCSYSVQNHTGCPTSPAPLICHRIHCYVDTQVLTVI